MPIEVRFKADGTLRPTWYGRYEVNGKRYCSNLGVRVAGTPPTPFTLKAEGDGAFERSRATALAKLASIVEKARAKHDSARLVEKLYEIKTGEQIQSVMLAELPKQWDMIPRKRTPNGRYAEQCRSTLARFVAFVGGHNSQITELGHVTRQTARAFLSAEADRGVSAKTWNDVLKLMRATFKHVLPTGCVNPFDDIPTRQEDTIFRRPFTLAELKQILLEAQADDFIRPIIVTAVCTAMRRGDCCLLKWKDVDLGQGCVTVKTAKTGSRVQIPIFPLLLRELLPLQAGRVQRPETHVFPDQAAVYLRNPEVITHRVRAVLAKVGFHDGPPDEGEPLAGTETKASLESPNRIRTVIAKAMALEPMLPRKRETMTEIVNAYLGGLSVPRIAQQLQTSKGTVFGHLKQAESMSGVSILRARRAARSIPKSRGAVTVAREKGLRRASVRDFHSFRVTWITLAMSAGLALEVVQRVTGHKTAEIVMKHYYKPGFDAFSRILYATLPKLLTSGADEEPPPISAPEALARAVTALAEADSKDWKIRVEEAMRLIRQAGDLLASSLPASTAQRQAT